MDKYKKLISNTIIFAISTFGSKVLVFLLMPLYTRVLDTSQYGVTDLIMNTGNLLIPLVSLGIVNAVLRFGLDKETRKSDVFCTGILCVFAGFAVLLLAWPLLSRIEVLSGNTALIYVFILLSSLRSLCAQFTRSRGMVRLFAVDGILSTLTMLLFQIWFLVGLKWGVFGYIIAISCSDAISVVFLTINGTLWKFIRFRNLDFKVMRDMVKYAVPMIPNTVLWWVTNASNRFFITSMLGEQYNGLFAAAYKVPSIVTLVSGFFMDAWQMSAVTEERERGRFFSKVFKSYSSILFMLASGAILFSKVITKIMVAPSYYESWKYIPILVLATVYSCLTNFLGSIYMVEKKSILSLITTTAGTAVSILLNFLLIPKLGVNGAAVATLVSYFLVFLLRARDTKRLIHIHLNGFRIAINTLILAGQCAVILLNPPFWILWETLLSAFLFAANAAEIFKGVKKLLHKGSPA